ncbi:MAG TPA: class I SAM-dependent methyltransferase [Thermoplasmata archaeon]|nr:class I SAM-dependent methyltransferase [Thermoplasmata archaeon]
MTGARPPGRRTDAARMYHALAPYYDRLYAGKEYGEEVRALAAIARRTLGRSPRSVLDVACGTGRHLEEFARTVPELAGIDASGAMLCEARRRLGPRASLVRADMRSFDLDRTFDLVVCLFSAIGHLRSARDRAAAFTAFRRHARPGGLLLVEGWIRPDRFRASGIYLQEYRGPDATIVRLSRSERRGALSRIEMQYLIGEPGRPVRHLRELHEMPLVPVRAMLRELSRAGFRAGVRFGPVREWRDRGLYVGRRPPSD